MAEWALVQIVAPEGRLSAVHLSVFPGGTASAVGLDLPTELGRSRFALAALPRTSMPQEAPWANHPLPCSPAVRLPVAAMQSASSYTSPTPCLPRLVSSGQPPTITTPARYNEVASAALQLLAEASTMFARFKASKRL